jgi:enamine deaminase RidA (YjgF/YER057c/UK114 family)
MTRRTIIPAALQPVYDRWHFAPAVSSSGFIFCSGIVGTSADGNAPDLAGPGAFVGAQGTATRPDAPLDALVAVRDPEAQFATAFEALRAILAEAGATLADIVELTTYHVDMKSHMAVFMQVRDRYLCEPYPAWTAIGVSELIVPGGLVELRAVAAAPK